MTPKKIPFNYDINRMEAVDLVSIIHIDDYDTRFLELILSNEGSPLNVDGCTVTARFVTAREKYLLSDNVPCVAESNTITIPIDAAAVNNMACDIKIEVNLVDGERVLTLPFPLWIRVRGSILDDAQVTPDSEGTIPELLKAAQEALDAATAALEVVGDYENLENKPQINGVELVGNKASAQLGLQKELTAGENVTINENGVISASGGTDDYNDLSNKPSINNVELSGNKTPTELDIDDYEKLRNLPKIKTITKGHVMYQVPLSYALGFSLNDFYCIADQDIGSQITFPRIYINDRFFNVVHWRVYDDVPYDFNLINTRYYHAGAIWFKGAEWTTNFPASLSEIDRAQDYFIIHYTAATSGTGLWYTRKVVGKTTSGKYVEYAQMFAVKYPSYESGHTDDARVTAETPWQKLGGSQIVSGVVNQNGTITFTDSDDNTFTTTGASVIGPQGDDYVLTNQDKTDIANIVLQLLPTTQGVLYGNAGN